MTIQEQFKKVAFTEGYAYEYQLENGFIINLTGESFTCYNPESLQEADSFLTEEEVALAMGFTEDDELETLELPNEEEATLLETACYLIDNGFYHPHLESDGQDGYVVGLGNLHRTKDGKIYDNVLCFDTQTKAYTIDGIQDDGEEWSRTFTTKSSLHRFLGKHLNKYGR